MECYIWPQIPPADNPLRHVTNGVHVPTFMAAECAAMLDLSLGGEWRNRLLDKDYWQVIDTIPDHRYWSMRQSLKSHLMDDMCRRLHRQLRRNGLSEAHIRRVCRQISPNNTDVLILGFARRFATYKRALLIFSDPARLARLLNDPERPVLLIFAGKAHPADEPGKELIRMVHRYSTQPEFEGKLFLLENYDLAMARVLVTGVDVWLNNPKHPLEASGTSGQKAGMNGVINLSVLDGWWDEAYDGENGWAITPHGEEYDADYASREEALEIMDIIDKEVVPLYYQHNTHGYPEGWVRKSKASMRTILPRYNAQRMLMDYIQEYYASAASQSSRMLADDFNPARELAQWKTKIREAWERVRLHRVDEPISTVDHGATVRIRVAARLDELTPQDVVVECLVGKDDEKGEFDVRARHHLSPTGEVNDGETLFELHLLPDLSGLQYYKLRMYPYHSSLAHPFEMGFMLWV
jgi:starch phosphorylase